MDHLQQMGAIRLRIQIADKDITKTQISINVLLKEKLCVCN